MMLHKIEPSILKNIKIMSQNNEKTHCIIYANDHLKTKEYMEHNFKTYHEFPFIRAFGVELDMNSLSRISNLEAVKYITTNTKVSTLVYVSNKILGTSDKTIIPSANFSIAIIDTGIYPH